MLGIVILADGTPCRAMLGVHMGKSVAAVVAEDQFIAIRRIDVPAMFEPLRLDKVPGGMSTWEWTGFQGIPKDELIIKDTDHEEATAQDNNLQPREIAVDVGA